VSSIQNETKSLNAFEVQIYVQICKLRHIYTKANAHCITCYHDVCCSIKYYTFQETCEFSTNQLNLSTTSSDSVNGVSQPRTRKQDTHYAIITQADVFTNTRNARYDLGTEHGWRFKLLEQLASHRKNASAGTFKDLQLDYRQGMCHIVETPCGCQKLGAPHTADG